MRQHSIAQALLCVVSPPGRTRATPVGGGAPSQPGPPPSVPAGFSHPLRGPPASARLSRTAASRPVVSVRPFLSPHPAAPGPRSQAQLLLPTCSSSPVSAWPALTIHEDNPRPLDWPPAHCGPSGPLNGVHALLATTGADPSRHPACSSRPSSNADVDPSGPTLGSPGPSLSPGHINCSAFLGPYAKTAV